MRLGVLGWALATAGRTAYLYFTGLPAFDPLRSDSRFGALLERLGLSPALEGRAT